MFTSRIIISPFFFQVLFLCLGWILAVTVQAMAYFQLPHDLSSDGFTLHPSRCSAKVDSSRLGLYPDIKALAGRSKASFPYYGPYSRQLSPVQAIDFNPQVIGTTGLPATTLELSLKNLLYADLKLQKLLQEYQRVQARARELLDQGPGTASGQGQGKAGHSQNVSTHWASTHTVQEHTNILKRWKHNEARRVISLARSSEQKHNIKDSILGSLVSLRETFKEKSFSVQDLVAQKSQTSDGAASSGPVSLTETNKVKIRIDAHGQDNELPWIFRKILAGLGYVFVHKVEAALIGMSLFALGGILVSLRNA